MGQKHRRLETRDRLIHYMGGKCLDCGLAHTGDSGYIYDFHHLNPAKKLFSISTKNIDRRMSVLCAEADKTVLLCANCHRHRQYKQGIENNGNI